MSYRDDREPLEERRIEIERELGEIAARVKAAEGAAQDRTKLERELHDLQGRLRRRLPALENVRVASPCSASWDAMIGDERVRFCASCQKDVYNLSAMGRSEAEKLVADREGRMCVRFFQRADGTVLTSDCPVGVKKKRVRRLAIAVAFAGSGITAVVTFATRMTMGALPHTAVQGELVAPPTEVMGVMPSEADSSTPNSAEQAPSDAGGETPAAPPPTTAGPKAKAPRRKAPTR